MQGVGGLERAESGVAVTGPRTRSRATPTGARDPGAGEPRRTRARTAQAGGRLAAGASTASAGGEQGGAGHSVIVLSDSEESSVVSAGEVRAHGGAEEGGVAQVMEVELIELGSEGEEDAIVELADDAVCVLEPESGDESRAQAGGAGEEGAEQAREHELGGEREGKGEDPALTRAMLRAAEALAAIAEDPEEPEAGAGEEGASAGRPARAAGAAAAGASSAEARTARRRRGAGAKDGQRTAST